MSQKNKKVNSLYNYFTSPKNPKSGQGKTPATSNDNKPVAKPKPTTPKREPNPAKAKVAGKGKDVTPTRKRPLKERNCDEQSDTTKPKRRRIIIPEDSDVEDSEDEYKPQSDDEVSDEDVSEGVTENEPSSESDEETPKKKGKRAKVTKAKTSNKKNKADNGGSADSKSNGLPLPTGATGPASGADSWPHLHLDFLKPDKIKDAKRRPLTDPNYDPRTLYVPTEFLNNQTPGMRQWWELKSKHFDCVLFFKVGKFYELYHMDAVTGATVLGISYMRGEWAHSGFPEIAYGRFSANLIERGYKVARVEQTETPEMAAERCKKKAKTTKFDKVVNREICQVTSRGTRVFTAQDSEIITPQSNYLLSLVEKRDSESTLSSFGICFLDTTIGQFHLGQFQDDRCNSRLLTLLAHHPPAQIIYERGNLLPGTMKILNNISSSAIKEPLQKEVQFWSAAKTLKYLHEANYFKRPSDSEFVWPEGLKPYLSEDDTLGLTPAEDKELAVNALGGCIFLLKEYLLDQQLLAQHRFQTYVPPDDAKQVAASGIKSVTNMVLDAITINNLKVLGGEGSLVTTLDHCCTAFGKRLLREWICRPSCQKTVINLRQEAIRELLERPDIVQKVRGMLGKLPDLERLISKIHNHGNALKAADHPDARAIMFERDTYSKRKILDFTTALEGFEETLKIISQFDGFNSDLIKLCTKLAPDGDFPSLRETLNHFKNAFDHEEAKKEGCIIPKTGVDSEYDSVFIEIEEIAKDIKEYLQSQIKHFGVKVTLYGSDKKRYQIEIPESQVKKIGSGYELQSQRKGFRRYYTAEGRELLARQIIAEDHRDKVLKDLNRRIFAQFSEKYDLWSAAAYRIAILDVLISLAEYARCGDMCVPEIIDDEKIFTEVRDGKHPCVMTENFVPNDTLLATNETASLVILTGPNMGGKSTLMRQVGLLTIMAQMGCHVPASTCRLALADRIFTRLGANDDILAGQSTFLVELSETAAILQHATPHSLVLLDELGRGTSTYDGTAIAAAVVDALTKLKCRTLFSTHYHSLVEDYKTNKDVTLAHMACMVETEEEEEISQETVTFLYKLSEGACPKSYGFNAARLAGIPQKITKRAHEIATYLEREANQKHAFIALCNTREGSIRNLIQAFRHM